MLQAAQSLMEELKLVVQFVVPCFPPDYKVFELFFKNYKAAVMDKVENYVEDMEAILTKDPRSLLLFNAFAETCHRTLAEMKLED